MKSKKSNKKVKKIKKPRLQAFFCLFSLLFIIGCCIFYGIRLVKYYRVFNPKAENGEALANLSTTIIANSQIVYEGDGLYSSNGNYIYKGENVNNYLMVSNLLFRIMKVNSDRTVEIVLDDELNELEWDKKLTSYKKSSIHDYLNNKFLDILDKDILEKTIVCDEEVKKVNEITCSNPNFDDYVKLLGMSDFLNSFNENNESYLTANTKSLWLYNHNGSSVWHTKGSTVSLDEVSAIYGIKPVLTLKNNMVLISGDGSINSPYKIVSNGEEVGVGTYLDINDDVYIVYEVGNDYYKIESNRLLKDTRIFDNNTNEYKDSALKDYLEDTYLKNLSYSKLLKKVKFAEVESEVGLLSRNDFKFNSTLENYFLSDKKDNNVYLYNGSLLSSRVNVKRGVRPCLGITKELDIISGNGSKMAPFIVEV